MNNEHHVRNEAPTVEYTTIRDELRTGDLLLCAGTSVMSRLIQRATGSCWSHVAIIVRVEEIDRVIVLESVESIGVRAVPLSRYVGDARPPQRGYDGEVMIARHAGVEHLTDERMRAMARFAADALGRRYDNAEILRIAERIVHGRFFPHPDEEGGDALQRDDAFICSEYVWECLRAAGIDVRHDPRGFIAPCDFADDPSVRPLWRIRH